MSVPPTQGAYICLHLLRPTLSSSPSASASNPTQQETQPQIPEVCGLLGAMVAMKGQAGIGKVEARGQWLI